MYTLHKAKEEIDAVAKHATDIAHHVLTLSADVHAELQSFKKEILDAIDAKFGDLERTIQGETTVVESSAIADLGAKVSLLSSAVKPAVPDRAGGEHEAATPTREPEHPPEQHRDDGPHDDVRSPQAYDDPNAGRHSEGHPY